MVLVTWDNHAAALSLIARLRGWRRSPTLLVVDTSASAAGRAALARELAPEALLLADGNPGYAGGSNLGIRRLLDHGCELVALANCDISVDERSFEALVAVATEGAPRIVGPLLCEASHGQQRWHAGGRGFAVRRNPRVEVEAPREHDQRLRVVAYVPGTLALIPRAVFERVGLLDEAYFLYGELPDFCARAARAGVASLIYHGARARHERGPVSAGRQRLTRYYTLRNRFLYLRRHPGPLGLPIACAWTLYALLAIQLNALRGRRALVRALRAALCDGLRGRFHIAGIHDEIAVPDADHTGADLVG